MKKNVLFLGLVLIWLSSFSQNREALIGLWLVDQVKVGDEVMTPDAKWTRLNADGTQESGNGWFQHSFGTWEYDQENRQLVVVTENGLVDPFGGFQVTMTDAGASWSRVEEGMEVLVSLSKANKLPSTTRDKMLGLWKLSEVKGEGPLVQGQDEKEIFLFIRWDGKFVLSVGSEKQYGVYNVHAHRPEIELIPYGDKQRSWWQVSVGDQLNIHLLNTETTVTRKFVRVNSYK